MDLFGWRRKRFIDVICLTCRLCVVQLFERGLNLWCEAWSQRGRGQVVHDDIRRVCEEFHDWMTGVVGLVIPSPTYNSAVLERAATDACSMELHNVIDQVA